MQKTYALVDCNNFFASCERVFRPDLEHHPVLVLSNNDGCVIARSNEVKALGIKMGEPFFKIKNIVEKNNIKVFSTNFALYGDISNRIMDSLQKFSPVVEKYSIDEAFLDLTHLNLENKQEYVLNMKKDIRKWTGMPVSIGVAHSKVLCKIGNELVKKHLDIGGVIDLTSISEKELDEYLKLINVFDVWGVGRAYGKFLMGNNIKNAYELKYADKKLIRNKMGVLGERLILELNGTSAIDIEETVKAKKGISCTRTFAKDIVDYETLRSNIAVYTERACEKLRSQESVASFITVFIKTNIHRDFKNYYSNAFSVGLEAPSASSPKFLKAANYALDKIYKPGFSYKRAGLILSVIKPKEVLQYEIFNKNKEQTREEEYNLMNVIDKINRKHGRQTIKIATVGNKKGWYMKQMNKSPRYTSSWGEILEVK